MGMLMAMTMLEQEEAARKAAEDAKQEIPDSEIPFTDPEEPVEEPAKKRAERKPTATTRRRKASK